MPDEHDLIRTLRAALANERPATREEAQTLFERVQAEHNQTPREEFDGLSPVQMVGLLYAPFEVPELVTIAESLPRDTRAPILDLYGRMADAIGDQGLKATAKGNLPRKLVREAAFAYFPEHADIERHVFREEDFPYLHGVRLMAGRAGLMRKYKGKFVLTAKGRKLHDAAGAAGAYPALFETFARKFNWGYWDGFPPIPLIQESFLFSLRLLSRYGDEPRPETFYGEAFLRAFPMAVEEAEDNLYRSAEEQVRTCYKVRTFRFAELLGLAERTGPSAGLYFRTQASLIRKTPLLDRWVQFYV